MSVPESLLIDGNKIPEHAMVQVKNVGVKPHTFKWQKARYKIKPGDMGFVPYYAMVLSCGDPRTIDVPGDPRKAFRTDEFRRLCVKYGIYENHQLFPQLVPQLEVSTIQGERITTVLEDPFGESNSEVTQNVLEQQALQANVSMLNDKIAELTAQLAHLSAGGQSTVTGAAEQVEGADGQVEGADQSAGDAQAASPPVERPSGPPSPPPPPADPLALTESESLPVDSATKKGKK